MAIESGLPSRYEIRILERKHEDWAKAIVSHSNMFYSPVWPVLYPQNLTKLCYEGMKELDYLIGHQIDSGYSIGVFDKEYQFKRPESAATEGKLYWDYSDEKIDKDGLLEQMDFPLVTVAMSYDGFNPLDMEKMMSLLAVLPAFGHIYGVLAMLDKRDGASWQPKALGEVLMRNATSTRHDYEGKGLMRKLAQYLMRTSADKGFRGIQIESLSDGVCKVWSNPPAPFKGEIVSEFHMQTFEQDDGNGQMVHPFHPADQRATKIYVTLK